MRYLLCHQGFFVQGALYWGWLVGLGAAMTLYRRRTSRDDIERRKVRHHQVHIFGRVFLQIFSLPGRNTPLQSCPQGAQLLSSISRPHEPFSLTPLESIVGWAGKELHSEPLQFYHSTSSAWDAIVCRSVCLDIRHERSLRLCHHKSENLWMQSEMRGRTMWQSWWP